MPRSTCASCRGPLVAKDRHILCSSCLGRHHAEAPLTKGDYPKCDFLDLTSLRQRLAAFDDEPALPPLLLEPRKKKRRSQREPEPAVDREPMPVKSPRAFPSPESSSSPVLFTQADQRPSSCAAGLLSF